MLIGKRNLHPTFSQGVRSILKILLYVLIEVKITKYGTPTEKLVCLIFISIFRYRVLCRNRIGVDLINNLLTQKMQNDSAARMQEFFNAIRVNTRVTP